MDELGWDTAHIVGNSLGGWVAFELERRGRARSVTGIAPAGGWTRWSPVKFEVIAKFVLGMPILALARLLGQRMLRLPFSRRLATLPLSGSPDGISERQLSGIVDDAAHCPAYFQLLVKALLLHGLRELAHTAVPGAPGDVRKGSGDPPQQVQPAFHRRPAGRPQLTVLDGVGHVPMFEAPGRVTEVITEFLDQHSHPRAGRQPTSKLTEGLLQVLSDGIQEFLAPLPLLVRTDEDRKVFGHLAALDRLDDDVFQPSGRIR